MVDLIPSGVLRLGLAAGLTATVVMDAAMVVALSLLGEPPAIFFSFVGDTAAAFSAFLGIVVSGSIALGVGLHYLIGLALGVIFVTAARRSLLPVGGAALTLVAAVVFVQFASLVLLVPAARLLDLESSESRELFSLAVVFHSVWGLVLGVVYLYGTGPHRRASRGNEAG